MQELDISELAEKISEHRFDGSTNNMLADEIDRFRAGAGTAGISAAVDALQAVAQALGETENTLRNELGELGVEWESDASVLASMVLQEHAGFSDRAVELFQHVARQVFSQGEAFDRTLHKLPESQILRDAPDEYSTVDSFLGLFGHETDNAAQVDRAREARDQALEVLADYARDSGANFRGTEMLEEPPEIRADTGAPPADSAAPPTGGVDDVPDDVTHTAGESAVPGTATGFSAAPGPTTAASGGTGSPAGTGAPAAVGGAVSASDPASRAGGGVAAASTGPRPSGITEGTGAGSSESTARNPAAFSPSPRGAPGIGGESGPGAPGNSGRTTAAPPSSSGSGAPVGPSPGQQTAGGAGDGSRSLSPGPLSGAAPNQPESSPTGRGGAGPSGGASRGMPSGSEVGGAAAAVGAGGAAGALSGDGERKGRGVGRNAPGASRSPRALALGDLPEEEARVERRSERLGARSGQTRDAFLSPATSRDDDEDDSVRRFGVDDHDLFVDPRPVSPDVIGEEMPE